MFLLRFGFLRQRVERPVGPIELAKQEDVVIGSIKDAEDHTLERVAGFSSPESTNRL